MENRQGVAFSQALLSTDLTCLNDRQPTRLVLRPRDIDGGNKSGMGSQVLRLL